MNKKLQHPRYDSIGDHEGHSYLYQSTYSLPSNLSPTPLQPPFISHIT
jgi:hypothetical protein